MIDTNPKKIEELLTRRVERIVVRKSLEEKLRSGKKLRIKWGVDPSRPDIHIGHSIILKKLQKFQELGHQVVFIVGDFTGQIGDPSGKSKTRPQLSEKIVNKNAETYFGQIKKVIDIDKVEIRRNSEWYKKMKLEDMIKLAGLITAAKILEREDFSKRMKKNADIHMHEMFYPILQAYDSIAINADVEIGGNDQTLNILMGRTLQKRMNKPKQDVIILPLLVGLDGKNKMSKSLDNYIGVIESSKEQFGKVMSIPDHLIIPYFELATDISMEKVKEIKKDLKSKKLNPRKAKARLAKEIVAIYHSKKEAVKAEKEFDKVFKEHKKPEKIPEIKIQKKELPILDLLVKTKMSQSKAEAKRLIEQGGVKINDKKIDDWKKNIKIKSGLIIQVGPRKFIKIRKS